MWDDTDQSMGEYEEQYALAQEAARPPKPTATIWVTREGQRIKVKDMTDSHLVNTIRYLRRIAHSQMMKEVVAVSNLFPDTDIPDDAYEYDDADHHLSHKLLTFPAMLREAEKRKLQL